MILFFIFYQTLQLIALPFFVLYLVIRAYKKKVVFGNLPERFGFVPKVSSTKHVVWLHAVSVGEVLSLQSLIEKIKKSSPKTICYLTVGTATGKKMALEKLNADYVSFLPYDFLPCMLLAYHRIKPKRLLIVEAEIWPNFLMLARLKKVTTFLLNARISQRSKKRYQTLKLFVHPLFKTFTKIYTQSNGDREAFIDLGVKKEVVEKFGNIKITNVLEKHKKFAPKKSPLNAVTLLAGSIHPEELDIYLTLFSKIKKDYPNAKLILAPRHFHWKETLIKKVKQTGFCFFVWENLPPKTNAYDIILVCKLGELFGLYQHATLYFLGGTFVPIGGHNLLEPAVWSLPTLIGPYYHTTTTIAHQLQANNNVIITQNQDELIAATKALLHDKTKRDEMGKNGRTWIEKEARLVEKNIDTLLKKLV